MNSWSVSCLAGMLLLTSGCLTRHVVNNKAKPHLEFDPAQQQNRQVEGRPGYYALLPLTLTADLITSPVQLFLNDNSSGGMMTVDGWPVPLP
jgi:hypothetical protein